MTTEFFVDNAYTYEIGEIVTSQEEETGEVLERVNRDTLLIKWSSK